MRLTRTTDGSGSREVRRLSPEDFAVAWKAHARALWCVARAVLGRVDQVEDVLQDGAVIALRKLDQFDADSSFLAWMSQIIRFVALNYGRRRQRDPATSVEPATLDAVVPARAVRISGSSTTSRGALYPDQTAFDDAVAHALTELDDTARACLLLRTVSGLPYREIALALDIPEGTAMSHVHRARQLMRRRLTDTPAMTGGTP